MPPRRSGPPLRLRYEDLAVVVRGSSMVFEVEGRVVRELGHTCFRDCGGMEVVHEAILAAARRAERGSVSGV